MSDLISRSELINALKVHFDSCFREDGELLYSDHICTSDDVVDLIKLVESQPTVYSVDKVVEELEERTDFLKNCTKYGNKNAEQQAESYSTMMMYEVTDLVDDLIEIVKHGGASDDVCEWKLEDEEANLYLTGCQQRQLIFDGTPKENGYRYCPYCGKKIKFVGD